MKLWIVVATWLMGWSIALGSSGVLTSAYPTIGYNLEFDFVPGNYEVLIEQLRQNLESGNVSYGIPVLPLPSDVPWDSDKRFVIIEFYNTFAPLFRRVKVALDATDAGVVAFAVGQDSYFFNDVSDKLYESPLFNETTKSKLPYGGNYSSLEEAGAYRGRIKLGSSAFNSALLNLSEYPSNTTADIASPLVVVIQMTSEAARLKIVEDAVVKYYYEGFIPQLDLISYENAWRVLSFSIVSSTDGTFWPVVLLNDHGLPYFVNSVVQVQSEMGLLLGYGFIPILDGDRIIIKKWSSAS